jgi:hypothetical protein
MLVVIGSEVLDDDVFCMEVSPENDMNVKIALGVVVFTISIVFVSLFAVAVAEVDNIVVEFINVVILEMKLYMVLEDGSMVALDERLRVKETGGLYGVVAFVVLESAVVIGFIVKDSEAVVKTAIELKILLVIGFEVVLDRFCIDDKDANKFDAD